MHLCSTVIQHANEWRRRRRLRGGHLACGVRGSAAVRDIQAVSVTFAKERVSPSNQGKQSVILS